MVEKPPVRAIDRSRTLRSVFLSCALMLAAAAPARGASAVFVDASGICAGLAPCFTTIQDGVDNAGPPPAVVSVFPGDYAESVDIGTMGSAIAGVLGDLTLRTVNGAGVPTPGTVRILPATGPALRNTAALFTGDVSIQGFILKSPDDDGISFGPLQGTLDVSGVISDGNFADGLSASIMGGDVLIRDSSFSDNGDTGISFATAVDVRFERVTADGNGDSGASFALNGDMYSTDSSFSDNEAGDGLSFATAKEVVLQGVTANRNRDGGVSFAVAGPVHISGSTFNDNPDGSGASFATATEVIFEDVVANGNGDAGASFAVAGPVRITRSTFNDNKDNSGVEFATATDVLLEDVVANRNDESGANFAVDGPVRIVRSTFNDNGNDGFSFATATDVVIDRVTADRNRVSGTGFAVSGRVTATDSSFSGNKSGQGLSFDTAVHFEAARIVAVGNDENGIDAAASSARILASRFENNGRAGVELGAPSPPGSYVLRCNDIAGNRDGLVIDTDAVVDAEQNWWGSPTGPTHPTNPGGTGDTIRDAANGGSGTVDFQPFLTEPAAESGICVARSAPLLDRSALVLLAVGLGVLATWRLSRRSVRQPAR